MAANGVALVFYLVLAVMVLVGLAVILGGAVARRRGASGTPLIIIGAVIALSPAGITRVDAGGTGLGLSPAGALVNE